MTTEDTQMTEQEYSTDELDRRISLIVEDVLDDRLGELEETDETIAEHIVDAHEAIESRIDGVSTRIDRLEDRLATDELRIDAVERETGVDLQEERVREAVLSIERTIPLELDDVSRTGTDRAYAELLGDEVDDRTIEILRDSFDEVAIDGGLDDGRLRVTVADPTEEAIDR